ncbi:MAG TPA: diguanylate cyclase [Myxococcota bacterium]|nr:diguanylate cyclase [Myxococcota bacterium]HRY94486.1 diguanylate cyclase [Myxococcota bacterium]HSA20066.1 diguanylate cyclase [Myxococcota bacterium]
MAADDLQVTPRVRRLAFRIGGMLLALLALAGLEWLNETTGPDYALSFLYLAPVGLTAWWFGRAAAVVVGLCAAAAWFLSELAWRPIDTPMAVLWNTLSLLVIFVSVGLLVGRIRRDREAILAANRRLSELLASEATLARTDPITELPNWRAFEEQLGREIARARRIGQPLGVGYLDLDNFKRVNDRFGHGAGDALLRKIALTLRTALRPEDALARMGGDEFAFVLSEPRPEALEEIGARLVAQVRALAEAYPGTDLGASVGLAWGPTQGRGQEELIQRADQAMYQAKHAGKNRVQVVSYEPSLPIPGGHERSPR